MDDLEGQLARELQDLPGGGGRECNAYGRRQEAQEAASLVRRMIEGAVREHLEREHGVLSPEESGGGG